MLLFFLLQIAILECESLLLLAINSFYMKKIKSYDNDCLLKIERLC